MFGFFKRRPGKRHPEIKKLPEIQPAKERDLHPENPGKAVSGKVAFRNASASWEEHFNVLDLLQTVLVGAGEVLDRGNGSVRLSANRLLLQPRLSDFQPLEEGGVRTTTTIEISHPEMLPEGVFEYQHSNGRDMNHSIRVGFEQWLKTDLPVFQDLFNETPSRCLAMQFIFPADEDNPPRKRQILLGPVACSGQSHQPAVPEESADVHPPFCNCCMFSRTAKAFERHLHSNQFFAIRFFGMRTVESEADCRVNGLDWEPGAQAIREYVATWPDRGVEFRKQLGIIRSIPFK